MLFKNKIITTFALCSLSSAAFATCPPIVPCKPTGEASTIAGSNADQKLMTMSQNITQQSNEISASLVDMGNALNSAVTSGAQVIITTNAEISQNQLNQTLATNNAMAKRDMEHQAQMVENARVQSISIVSKSDTKEEFELILDSLEKNAILSVPEIILVLQETVDKNPNGKVLVPLLSSVGTCTQDQINQEGKCAIPVKAMPGQKLTALFARCNAERKRLIEMSVKKESKQVSIEMSNKRVAEVTSSTDSSGALSVRMKAQTLLSCTPSELKNGACGDISPEEYQESIVSGKIIPNGDLSATNFSSPADSSADGFIDDFSDEEQRQIQNKALDRTALVDSPNQKVVPIIHTYRNANQVQASMSFIDNLVGDDLVSSLEEQDKRKLSSAVYQSRFQTRIASLSMVRLVMNESMSLRIGDTMRGMIKSGAFDEGKSFDVSLDADNYKESVLGAGPLDLLEDRVRKNSSSMQKKGSGNDFIVAPSGGAALDKMIDSLQIQNELMLSELLMLEQMVSLDAISLAQKVNSPEMISKMEKLRSAR